MCLSEGYHEYHSNLILNNIYHFIQLQNFKLKLFCSPFSTSSNRDFRQQLLTIGASLPSFLLVVWSCSSVITICLNNADFMTVQPEKYWLGTALISGKYMNSLRYLKMIISYLEVSFGGKRGEAGTLIVSLNFSKTKKNDVSATQYWKKVYRRSVDKAILQAFPRTIRGMATVISQSD